MAKPLPPRVVTANDLMSGHVVYMTAKGSWTSDHCEATVAFDAAAADALVEKAHADDERIIGPYLVAVSLDDIGRPHPIHLREILRTRGPGNRSGHHTPATERTSADNTVSAAQGA